MLIILILTELTVTIARKQCPQTSSSHVVDHSYSGRRRGVWRASNHSGYIVRPFVGVHVGDTVEATAHRYTNTESDQATESTQAIHLEGENIKKKENRGSAGHRALATESGLAQSPVVFPN